MNDERAAEGIDHLQRAAREVVAAARSFLDVVEELVEDRAALNDLTTTLSGAAVAVGEVVRHGLGGRPAPWDSGSRDGPPWEEWTDGVHDDPTDVDDGDDVDVTLDVTDGPGEVRPTGRVRRIVVD